MSARPRRLLALLALTGPLFALAAAEAQPAAPSADDKRAAVLGFPVRLRQLMVSVDDPEALAAQLLPG